MSLKDLNTKIYKKSLIAGFIALVVIVVIAVILIIPNLIYKHGENEALAKEAGIAKAHAQQGLTAKIVQQPIEKRLVFTAATIITSLSKAAKQAGLNNQQLMQLATIFQDKIDFNKNLRRGDHFNVLYTVDYLDGKRIRRGNIMAAEFTNRGKTYTAIRFTDSKNHSGYYTPEGRSLKLSILRASLKYKRISSYFGSHRLHPILKIYRPHEGVDYAAPRGTPVKAAGNGVVTFIGRESGYGKVIFIQHNKKYATYYAHLSHYAKRLKRGNRVKQGQVIGYVGSTGLATGPHLHYEIRVNGIARDPLKVALPNAKSIPKAYLAEFKEHAAKFLNQLAQQESGTRS